MSYFLKAICGPIHSFTDTSKINDGKRRDQGAPGSKKKHLHCQSGVFLFNTRVNDHLVTILHKQTSQRNEETPLPVHALVVTVQVGCTAVTQWQLCLIGSINPPFAFASTDPLPAATIDYDCYMNTKQNHIASDYAIINVFLRPGSIVLVETRICLPVTSYLSQWLLVLWRY